MDWTYNTLWTEQLPPGTYKSVVLGRKQVDVNASGCKYVIVTGFAPATASLTELRGMASAEYLELNRSNVRSFEGVSALGPIKRLEMHYCLKLQSHAGLVDLKDSLEWLHINQSKKLNLSENLAPFRALKVLCLNSCAPLEDLNFLHAFPQLLDFRFVNTNVLNGDLTPLLKHPSLVTVGFLNKKHYSHTEAELDAHFGSRLEAIQDWVYKGPYRTFKYRPLRA